MYEHRKYRGPCRGGLSNRISSLSTAAKYAAETAGWLNDPQNADLKESIVRNVAEAQRMYEEVMQNPAFSKLDRTGDDFRKFTAAEAALKSIAPLS